MKPLPAMPQVIDYACSPFKSEEADIFLAASCRFFFGVASGMSNVASVFGVPVGAGNFFPIGEGMVSSSDVTVPKLYRERATGRILPFDECLRLPLALTYDSTRLQTLGIETIDTDAEDLRDLAVEMLERTEGRRLYDGDDEALQKRWNDLSRSFSIADVGGRIGRSFLRRHRHLFGAP
jgi:putative glycosyltransferase (TIGR04372 family)